MIRTWLRLVPADRRGNVIAYTVLALISVVVRAVAHRAAGPPGRGVVQRHTATRAGVAGLADRRDGDRMGDRHRDRANRFQSGLRRARPHPARRGGPASRCAAGLVQRRPHRDGATGDRLDGARTRRPGGQPADAAGHRSAVAGGHRAGAAAGLLAARRGRDGWRATAAGRVVGLGTACAPRGCCGRRSQHRADRAHHRIRPHSAGIAGRAARRAGPKPGRRRTGRAARRDDAVTGHADSRASCCSASPASWRSSCLPVRPPC